MSAKAIAVGLYVFAACMTTGSLNAKIVEPSECEKYQIGSDYCANFRSAVLGQEIGHIIQGAAWPLYWAIHIPAIAFGGQS